jgi:hypothetical protein
LLGSIFLLFYINIQLVGDSRAGTPLPPTGGTLLLKAVCLYMRGLNTIDSLHENMHYMLAKYIKYYNTQDSN